ncbi:MAG: prepilin-type N-terminal cleavage/methylation domain-containing protein [Pseudomonadota bacterium]
MSGIKEMKKTVLNNSKGFTLIEIAIVLVIIGLIIGAAVKGKDLIQSGKQKKFYTNVIKAWELTVVSYYDRTGMLLGDGTVNGGTAAAPNSQFDNIWGNAFDNANGVDATIQKVGLTLPTSNTAESGQNTYKGSYGAVRTINMRLEYAGGTIASNCLRFNTMPVDLAIAIDTMVDGQMDPQAGNFRIVGAATAWPDASAGGTANVRYLMDIP